MKDDEYFLIDSLPELVEFNKKQHENPKLADKGIYLASESTIYRILNEEKMNAHRNRSKEPVKSEATTNIATAPNQVWTWDITWLNALEA